MRMFSGRQAVHKFRSAISRRLATPQQSKLCTEYHEPFTAIKILDYDGLKKKVLDLHDGANLAESLNKTILGSGNKILCLIIKVIK